MTGIMMVITSSAKAGQIRPASPIRDRAECCATVAELTTRSIAGRRTELSKAQRPRLLRWVPGPSVSIEYYSSEPERAVSEAGDAWIGAAEPDP